MEKERMNEQEMEKASGGWDGEYKYIGDYSCPSCGTVNPINRYCTSGQSTWTCQKCGTTFTIRF
jgi:ribosomal protein L37AE/L43A